MPAATPDPIKADKEGELVSLQESIEKFKKDAQSSYQKKQTDLLGPIQKKIGDVIADVARENGQRASYAAISLNGSMVLSNMLLFSLSKETSIFISIFSWTTTI